MNSLKRSRSEREASDDEGEDDTGRDLLRSPTRPPKRRRVTPSSAGVSGDTCPDRDRLSPLSDELLVRILSFLSLPHLLAVVPVSRRFYHLSADSQLWKALYYARFVLPRAMRIPGFRDGLGTGDAGHKLYYSGRRSIWADGRRGGLVRAQDKKPASDVQEDPLLALAREASQKPESVNWKRQYKIRYNWSRGKCAVEELDIGEGYRHGSSGLQERKILAKVVEGIAITADRLSGLRTWNLKSRQLLAQTHFDDEPSELSPSCIAIDDTQFDAGILHIAVGFMDGSFGVWKLYIRGGRLVQQYKHEKSSNGELVAMSFSYPYLLTATGSVLISLYTFDAIGAAVAAAASTETRDRVPIKDATSDTLPAPYLLTSLGSHTSRPPLALSIRKLAETTVASIAYIFTTRQGWSIGVQDLHLGVPATGSKSVPEVVATRIAYTSPVDSGGATSHTTGTPSQSARRRHLGRHVLEPSTSADSHASEEPGPTTLCYSHPYLLATLPDNTLVLHMCKSNASSLSISQGIRLWGHTSGISDAEITARGKAVSVSSRGGEVRVWELEGRSNGLGSRSVEIRPGQSPTKPGTSLTLESTGLASNGWDERRNWVGFDDEMVIVLKEKSGGGGESLMVYDFT